MAYITAEQVKEKRNLIKKAFPAKEGWKFSVTREHHSSIIIAIMQYPDNYNFGTEHVQVNHYHFNDDDDYGDADILVSGIKCQCQYLLRVKKKYPFKLN